MTASQIICLRHQHRFNGKAKKISAESLTQLSSTLCTFVWQLFLCLVCFFNRSICDRIILECSRSLIPTLEWVASCVQLESLVCLLVSFQLAWSYIASSRQCFSTFLMSRNLLNISYHFAESDNVQNSIISSIFIRPSKKSVEPLGTADGTQVEYHWNMWGVKS